MKALFCLVVLVGCGFEHGALTGGTSDATDGRRDGNGGSGSDAMTNLCGWSYSPTNFDPCALPAPAALHVTSSTTIDIGSTSLPKLMLSQSDGSPLVVIHLSSLTIDPTRTLTITGAATVFAVDSDVNINGTLTASTDVNNPIHCATGSGTAGTDSNNSGGGAGGGGGGGAAAAGGKGGNGGGTMNGTGGGAGAQASPSTLSPLRGGCSGGASGKYQASGVAAEGGRGGGAVQISTNTKTTVTFGAKIDAAGRGGAGAPAAHIGGGGGGSGGGILLEGPVIALDNGSVVCADGGSGGEGGGSSSASGNSGNSGACTGAFGAFTAGTFNSSGGGGGGGGYSGGTGGGGGGSASSSGGGGGGGGGIGWIRIKTPSLANNGIITPDPQLN